MAAWLMFEGAVPSGAKMLLRPSLNAAVRPANMPASVGCAPWSEGGAAVLGCRVPAGPGEAVRGDRMAAGVVAAGFDVAG